MKSKLSLIWILSSGSLLILLGITNPERVGPSGVAVFFGLFYIWIFCGILAINRFIFGNRDISLSDSREFAAVSFIALIPTLALALQSLNQLAWRDVFILISLVALSIFYWTRRG